jgi:hypothetical protein
LTLSNGARIIALPGKEETIRGFSGVTLLVIDEAARVLDDLYQACRPMLAVSGGRIILDGKEISARYREWLIPAKLINANMKVRIVPDEELEDWY